MTRSAADIEQGEWYRDGLRFTCTQCGNCCTGPPGYVWFDEDEVRAMAGALRMEVRSFLRRFAHKVNGYWSLNEIRNGSLYDCVFLERDDQGRALCRVYETRPRQCRTWPFWPENLETPKDYQRAAVHCPGMARGLSGKGRFYPLEKIRVIRDNASSI